MAMAAGLLFPGLTAAREGPGASAGKLGTRGDSGKNLGPLFHRHGQQVRKKPVEAGCLGGSALSRIRAFLSALIAGPPKSVRAGGVPAGYPAGARLLQVKLEGGILRITLKLPSSFLAQLKEIAIEEMARPILVSGTALTLGLKGVILQAPDPADGKVKPLTGFLSPIEPVAPKQGESMKQGAGSKYTAFPLARTFDPPVKEAPPWSRRRICPRGTPVPSRQLMPWESPRTPQGFLSGKVVYLSPGHGWYWNPPNWRTQRGNSNGLVEDMSNAEALNSFLLRYLRNAGATVFTVRESDRSPYRVVVDDGDGSARLLNGRYTEEGESTLFSDSANPGFANGQEPYESGQNPFALGNGRLLSTAMEASAWARWTPVLPLAGHYSVYVSYYQDQGNAPDAHYVVHHAGGATHFRVDQRRHGQTWVYLGTFYFRAGSNGARGSVVLLNDSEEQGAKVHLDAVRFGGGMSNIQRSGSLLERPLWEMAARYYTQYCGAPTSVYDYRTEDNNDDVVSRSRYAAWQNETGEDAIYFSWHTNAPDGGRGTSSFIYGPTPAAAAGSEQLQNFVHGEVLNDIRAAWDPDWKDRGKKMANFGEVNPSHNPEMPSMLIEVAFHATAVDAESLKHPRFRNLVSRAIYQGMVKYFADRDGVAPRQLPEPPRALAAVNSGFGQVRLSWQAPESGGHLGDPAESYRVYTSTDGLAFDSGITVNGTSHEIDCLIPGTVLYFKVTAVNEGGESFPGMVVGVRVAGGQGGRVLIVNGYQRFDPNNRILEDLSGFSIGTVWRIYPERINSFDYVIQHGEAVSAFGAAFDSASNEAVTAGDISLSSYGAVDWILGEESTEDETFSEEEQALISTYTAAGGAILVSGAELAWDLDQRGSSTDRQFLQNILRVEYASDDSATYGVEAVPGGIFDGLAPFQFDNGTFGTYDVDYPDVFTALTGEAALVYAGGGGVAAVAAAGPVYRSLTLGFPLETIYPRQSRIEVFARALTHLGLSPEPDGGLLPCVTDGGMLDGGLPDPDGGVVDGGIGIYHQGGGCSCSATGQGGALGFLLMFLLLGALLSRGRIHEPRTIICLTSAPRCDKLFHDHDRSRRLKS